MTVPPASTPLLSSLRQARAALDALLADTAAIAAAERAPGVIAACLKAGGKVLAVGNGGSCCDAAHFCEELTGRFRNDRPPLAAIACGDASHITCTANDYGFEHIFSRWVQGLGRKGDVLVALSTSGNSGNIVRAVAAAQHAGMTTIALLGRDGGKLRGVCEVEIIVPGEGSDRIQELHMLLLHGWVEQVERLMFPELTGR